MMPQQYPDRTEGLLIDRPDNPEEACGDFGVYAPEVG